MPLGAAQRANVAVRMKSEVGKESGENPYSTGFEARFRKADVTTEERLTADSISIFPAAVASSAWVLRRAMNSPGRTGKERRILRPIRKARPMAWSMSK